MEISQKILALCALYAVLVGIGLGMVYDVFRILRIARGEIPAEKTIRRWGGLALIFAEDILYALICAVVVTIFVFHVNGGRVRGFMLFCAGAGFALYYCTVGMLVMRISGWMISMIRRLLRWIIAPLCWLGRRLWQMAVRADALWYTRRRKHMLLSAAAHGFGGGK